MVKSRQEFLKEMKNQYWGVEIEFTGITRLQTEQILSSYLGDVEFFDYRGRDWSVMSDSSILPRMRNGLAVLRATEDYQVELVTPILEYDDIGLLQGLVRALQKVGGISGSEYQCGLHVHVSDLGHTHATLRNLIKIMRSKQFLLKKALQIPSTRLNDYCQYVDEAIAQRANRGRFREMEELKELWYRNSSRYAMMNLSSLFDGKGIEFRMYNGTLNPEQVKSCIQFSLGLAQSAKDLTRVCMKEPKNQDNDKYSMRNWLNRMYLTDGEFKDCRKFMTSHLSGDGAFANPKVRKKGYVGEDFTEEELPFY